MATLHDICGRSALLATLLSTIFTICPLYAGRATILPEVSKEPALADWWNRKEMTGNWFGVRNTLADHGIQFSGTYEGIFFGVVDSQKGARGFYDQELVFVAKLDLAKLAGADALKGLKGFAGVRWRDPGGSSNPNHFVQASSLFQPSSLQSGTQWRLLEFGLEYSTPELFGIGNFATLRVGWMQPQDEFIDQPLSKLFVSYPITSAKGIGGNIPFSSSFSSWGGTLKLEPSKWYYAKGGLFMAYPEATTSSNHGIAFEGFSADTSQNGLLVMGEGGVTPKLGTSDLPGKYAMGAYYYGQQANSFNGTTNYGQYGFYWQADQMLFRESLPEEPVPMGKGPSGGKSFKQAVQTARLSEQGLYSFSLLTFAPEFNNPYPFYLQTGLVYEGFIPSRDADKLMLAIAYGSYSCSNIQNLQNNGRTNQPNNSLVLEWDYRFQISAWATFQPFVQYTFQPGGTESVKNSTVLGFSYALNF